MTIRIDFLVIGAFVVMAIGLGTPGCSRKTAMVQPTPAEAPPVAVAPEEPTVPAEPPAPVPPPEMPPAFFDFDSNLLREPARHALDDVAKLMRDNGTYEVLIEGHCDERGTTEYNLALGEERAVAARQYLVMAGVSKERIHIVSFGEERPFDSGHDEEAWARNRRAHFRVTQAALSGGAED